MKPKILITGNCGFIGSHLQKKMEHDGFDVIGLDNLRWSTQTMHNTVIGDIRDETLVDHLVSMVDEVYHLAAQINVDYGNEHPQETVDINVRGTMNILEACRKYGKKLIFASTSEVYGTALTDRISEEHPTNSQGVYAASKLAGDRLCKAYNDAFNLDVKILRNFNVFGEGQRFDSYGGVIALFVHRALHNKPPIIYGDGEQERDYIYIDDALRGYELAANEFRAGDPVNISTGKTITINRLARLICDYTGCPEPIHTDARPGEVRRLCGDNTKAKKLGFEPLTNFEVMLYNYIDRTRELLHLN